MDGRLIIYYILPNHFFYLLFHLNLNDVIYEIQPIFSSSEISSTSSVLSFIVNIGCLPL